MNRLVENRVVRIALGLFLIPAFAFPAGVRAQEGEKDCMEGVRSWIPLDSRITVMTAGGETLTGDLRRIDSGRAMLSLRVYDPSVSRFRDQDVGTDDIRWIQYRTKERNLALPVLCGLALGGLGLAMGLSLHNDEDFGRQGERDAAPAALALLGAGIGFFPTLLLMPSRTTEGVIECGTAQGR